MENPVPYLLAETAFHHEGDPDYLKGLIRGAADAGANGIKFQVLIDIDSFLSREHKGYEMIRSCLFTLEQWKEFVNTARNEGLDIVLMPLDPGAFSLTGMTKVKWLELHSVSWYDRSVLSMLKGSGLPVILGAGGRSFSELRQMVGYFNGKTKVIMHGFQAFPTKPEDMRMGRIGEIGRAFPGIMTGFADHSSFDHPDAVDAPLLAAGHGAAIIEKHLTLEEGVNRIDYESAIGIEKMRLLKQKLSGPFPVTGESVEDPWSMSEAELRYRSRQKVAVSSGDFERGHVFAEKDVNFKMCSETGGIGDPDRIIGRKLLKDVMKERMIREEDIQ